MDYHPSRRRADRRGVGTRSSACLGAMNVMASSNGNGNGQATIESAVRERYAKASEAHEACLCVPSEGYDAKFLEVLPEEIIQRDYGCGDPSKWIGPGETVLDLGSGGGKICYICAQKVGQPAKSSAGISISRCSTWPGNIRIPTGKNLE